MADRLLLIADDLTGALDTAVRFSRAGASTFVTTRRPPSGFETDAAVLAADIESRHVPPAEAADRVKQWVEAARLAGITSVYKKTDSTLRGNVGAELAALLQAAGRRELYFVPALPDAGRITRGGIQYVDGQPLRLSRYSGDIAGPVHDSSVSAIIASQADTDVVCVPRGADPAAVLAKAPRPVILVFDAETVADLDGIAAGLAVLDPPPRLLAGCSGFASVVPRLLGLGTGAAPAPGTPALSPPPPSQPVLSPPLLVVCGSLNEVSTAQVRQGQAAGIRCWDMGARPPGGTAGQMRLVVDALRRDGAAVLTTGKSLPDSCDVVRRVLREVSVGTLAVFGGDTAFGIMDRLGVTGVWPLAEICQGVVVSRLEVAPFAVPTAAAPAAAATIHLVTKAGGFGPRDVIQRIRRALKEGA